MYSMNVQSDWRTDYVELESRQTPCFQARQI